MTLTSTHWGVYRVERNETGTLSLQPFEHDPDPSPIGRSIGAAVSSKTRVRRPAVREGFLKHGAASRLRRGQDAFVEVPWDEALDIAAAELRRVISTYGNEAVFGGSYGWSSAGRFHHAQSHVHRFLNLIGGYVRHVGTYSLGAGIALLPHVIASKETVMRDATAWVDLARHCQLFVAFGGLPARNAQVSNGGASVHVLRDSLADMARAGTRFVNISPLRGDLQVEPAAAWLPLRPGTDVPVMLALAHTLLAEGLHDPTFLETHCTGFERFVPYLLGRTDGQAKDAAWAAALSGIEACDIVGLARQMARSRTMINVSWSLQRADHGEQPYWAAVALAAMLGQIGLPGGGIGFGYGAINAVGANAQAFSGPVLPQGRNPVEAFIPVARIADALLQPGEPFDYNGQQRRYPDLKLVYWAGGNLFHHHQDINRLLQAWRRPECVITNEQFWTAHAKHSDIVLPATLMLERDDIGSAQRDRFIVAMKQACAPLAEARDDYWIFTQLAERLGVRQAYTEGRDVRQWLEYLYEESAVRAGQAGLKLPRFDVFWQMGLIEHPVPREPNVFLRTFRENPLAHPLPTPSGRIEIYSERIASFGYDDCPGHPVWLEPREWLGSEGTQRHPLHLISNQPHTRLHSQYDHGSESLANKVGGREPLLINPGDARARGLADGACVRVFNDRGACLAGLRFDEGLRPGVVQLATGAWYDPEEPGHPGTLCKHGSVNVLTPDRGTSRLAQGCAAQSTLVEVEPFAGVPPAVTAFDPPAFVNRMGWVTDCATP